MIIIRAIVVALLLGLPAVAQADEPSVPQQIGTKFMRGVTNLATGIGEIPKQIYLIGQKEGWVQGVFRGPFEGLGMFFARTVGGAYEILTFPIPVPSNYQPMMLPEYVWQPEPPSQLTVPSAELAAPMLTPDNR
jgi:putative exosortase-associated protein (TIGR04073 family)